MATFRGMDGSVTWATQVVGEIKAWSLNVSEETLETTKMGDAWRGFVGGLADWSGQATANLDYGDTNGQKVIVDRLVVTSPQSGTGALVLRQATTKTWSGNAIISGLNITQQMSSIVEVQFSFKGSGALAIAWS